MHNEARQVALLKSGNAAAFDEFLDRFGDRVHAMAWRYSRSRTESEDLTQEIFYELFRSLGAFRGASSLSTWVFRVAVNRCLRHVRDRGPTAIPLDDLLDPPAPRDGIADTVEQVAALDTVREALAALSADHRAAVELHELQGFTYGECAEILGVPVGTVKSRLNAAMHQMRGVLIAGVGPAAAPVVRQEASR